MKKFLSIIAVLALATTAYASATRILDGQAITNGANTLTLPTATDTLVGKATTDTLTNKSISGATNTLSAIPATAISSGQLGVANGGTGDATLTTNGMLFGNGTSAAGITAAGSQYQVFQAGVSGVPTVGALNIGQAAATTGQLPVASGGTGLATLTANAVVVGAGTSTPTFVAPGTSGNVLTSNGTVWSSTAPTTTSPNINGGSSSPKTVTASTGISGLSIGFTTYVWVTATGPITVTATPSITACGVDGQHLVVIGTSATNTITFQDQANLASSGLSLNGNWVASKDSALSLHCDATQGLWVEESRR